jgi:hypothetical protein
VADLGELDPASSGGTRRATVCLSPRLLDSVEGAIVEATGGEAQDLRGTLAGRMRSIEAEVLDPRLRSFVAALLAPLEREEWLVYVAATVAGSPPESWTNDDLAKFSRSLRELGATLRRIEALHYDRRATEGLPFDALRVTFTRPDGVEDARVVWTSDEVRAILEPVVREVLDRAAEVTGSVTGGLDTLLALLGSGLLRGMAEASTARKDDLDGGTLRRASG